MPNPLLPFFGLSDGQFISDPTNIGGSPAAPTPTFSVVAGTSGTSDPNRSLQYGTLVLVEPVFAERKDSGGLKNGKNGPVGHRHFVVPWKNTVTGQTVYDYMAQLIGKTSLVTAPNGQVVSSVTFPSAFHPTLPWLVCHDVEMVGEDWQGPDQYGAIQFRRALLKCQYQPLDFAEKLDTQTQFQSIPGQRWGYIGQDARRSLANKVITITTSLPGANVTIRGSLVLDITTSTDLGANPNFVQITVLIGNIASTANTLLPRLQQLVVITQSHNLPDFIPLTINLQAALANLTSAITTATAQTSLISTGSADADIPNMNAMQEMAHVISQTLSTIRDFAVEMQSVLTVARLPSPNVSLSQVQQIILLLNQSLPAIGGAFIQLWELVQSSSYPPSGQVTETIYIPFDSSNTTAGNPADPIMIQRQIETKTFFGAATVSKVRGSAAESAIGYEIRLFSNVNIALNPFTNLRRILNTPPVVLIPSIVNNSYTGVYHLSTMMTGLTLNFRVWKNIVTGFGSSIQPQYSAVGDGVITPEVSGDGRFVNDADKNRYAREIENVVNSILGREGRCSVRTSVLDSRDLEITITDDTVYPRPVTLAADGTDDPYYQPFFITWNNFPSPRAVVNINQASLASSLESVTGDTLAGRFISLGHYTIEKHYVPTAMSPIFQSLQGCINSKAFRNYGPWTLLLAKTQARTTHLMDGTPCLTMHFTLAYNPNTWNAVFCGKRNQYEFVRAAGQSSTLPGPGTVNVPAQTGTPAMNGQPAVPAQSALVIPLIQQQSLILPDGTNVPILTRGPGISSAASGGSTILINAVDYGMLYPVADFSIIDTFF